MAKDGFEVVGVVGAGTMGAGIAEVAARSGARVRLYDIDQAAVDRGTATMRQSVQRAVERGKATEEQAQGALGRVEPTLDLADFADCDVAIEVAPERLDLKLRIFDSLGKVCAPDALLASNTSSLSVTEIAAGVPNPERVIGLHFFNPAPVMALLEVVRAAATSDEALERGRRVAAFFGKTAVVTSDTPGFIVNRVARPFYLEGLRLVGDGYATVADVDAAARSAGFRMGPFELMDLIGSDVNFAVSSSIYQQMFHEPRFRPHLLQQGLVQAGRFGRKSTRGFYDYTSDPPHAAVPALPARLNPPDGPWEEWAENAEHGFLVGRLVSPLINEGYWAVGQGVATRQDVDVAMKLGTNWPKGPFQWADEIGPDLVIRSLEALRTVHGDGYIPAPLLQQ